VSSSTRAVAEAFSAHRFAEAYPALADDVRWDLVGQDTLVGRQSVVDACEGTLAALAGGTATVERCVVAGDGDVVAVDTVTRYAGADGSAGRVSSCDVYEFTGGRLTTIRSYTVEV
jgi:ketosteroid isomerase-like protein